MPILKFHLYDGRSPKEADHLHDVVHDVMVRTFDVPAADRYQIVSVHAPLHMRALDSGLGIPRTDKFVLLEVISRPRGKAAKWHSMKMCVPLSKRNAASRRRT